MKTVKYIATFFAFLFLFSCSKSKVVIQNLSSSLEGKDTDQINALDSVYVVSSDSLAVTYSGFEVYVSIRDDNNNNASAVVYYCNESDTPGCDPQGGDSKVLSRVGDLFVGNISNLISPYDPSDTINYLVVISDPDGVTNAPSLQQVTLTAGPPTKIYRSVGAGNTSALADHNSGVDTISIIGDQVSFSTAIPDNIGVGDVLVYDAGTKIAFIHGRTDSQNFTLMQADGLTLPEVQTTNNDWSIFRAYTSMGDAKSLIENTGIPAGVVDFDNGSRDLVTAYEEWHFAFYADGFDEYGTRVEWDNWTTSKVNFIKLYTPYLSSEVGVSQRHNGVFDEKKYYLYINANGNYARGITIETHSMVIDGLQIRVKANGYTFASGIQTLSVGHDDQASHVFSNNIIAGVVPPIDATSDQCAGIRVGSSASPLAEYFIYNNIIYGFQKNYLAAAINTGGRSYIYNNTVTKSRNGIYLHSGVGVLKNNLVADVIDSVNGNANIDSNNSTHNIFYTSDTNYTSTDRVVTNFKFSHPETYDFRISGNFHEAIGTGVDLSSDLLLPISRDIFTNIRSRWDVGATTAPKAIFRSVGQGNVTSLKGTSDRELRIIINSNGHTQLILENGTTDLPTNIGVGDVFQYDPNNTGGVDALAFIHERIDQSNYIVKNAAGENANITTSNSTSWDIFRSYSDIANSELGIENSGIDPSLRDFDTWSGGRDLNSNNEQWNLSLYADGTFPHLNVDDWITSSNNFLKIFAPRKADEVGTSQAHTGRWSTNKVHLVTSTNSAGTIYLDDGGGSTVEHVRIENLQIENTDTNPARNGDGINAGFHGENEYLFKNNIIRRTVANADSETGIRLAPFSGSKISLLNNVIEGYQTGVRSSIIIGGDNSLLVIANNTIINSTNGLSIDDSGDDNRWVVINNILSGSLNTDFGVGGTPDITNYSANMTSDSSSPGGAGEQNKTFSFYDVESVDYRLLGSDTAALGQGVNLKIHSYVSNDTDINDLPWVEVWDVGAYAFVDYSSQLTDWNQEGAGTEDDPYIIATKTQLLQIGPLCGGAVSTSCSSHFILVEDIDLATETWVTIGDSSVSFTGSFNGGNKNIQNLTISSGSSYVGFFGSITSADIKNLNIHGTVNGGGNSLVGILGGIATSSNITNVTTSGSLVSCFDSCGGLIGRANGSFISDSSSSATISAQRFVGGLVGTLDNSSVTNSFALGDVTATLRAAGGLIGTGGYAGGTIDYVYAEGNVTAPYEVGGLFGYMNRDNFNLSDCHATGNVTSNGDDSGLSSAGGLVGSMSGAVANMSITKCYALGDVYAPGQSVGGLVGHIDDSGTRDISFSWAAGDIKSKDNRTGGLVGYSSANISDSFATGRVEGYGNNGGLVGTQNDDSITRSYALGEVICRNTGLPCYAGGLVGVGITAPNISFSYAKGNVYSSGGAQVGGIAGRLNGGAVSDSFYEGSLSGGNTIGGILGEADTTTINRSYAKATINGVNNIGGIVGSSGGNCSDNFFIGIVSGNDSVGGLIGEQTGGTFDDSFVSASIFASTSSNAVIGLQTAGSGTNLYWNSDETSDTDAVATAKTTADLRTNDSLAVLGFDDSTVWTRLLSRNFPVLKASPEGLCIDNITATAYNSIGSGTNISPFIVCNKEQLINIGSECNSGTSTACSGIYILGSDIELNNIDFDSFSIGTMANPFTGEFDGRGHIIQNLTSTGAGLFDNIEGAKIKNLKFDNLYIAGASATGLFGDQVTAPIYLSHIDLNGYMETAGDSGSLFGNGLIDSTGQNKIIASHNNSYMNFYSTSTNGIRGGLIGDIGIEAYIFKNKYLGTMDFNSSNTGGIIGRGESFTFKNKTSGSITSSEGTVGGLFGLVEKDSSDNLKISRNISSIDLNTAGDRNGGLVGFSQDDFSLLNNSLSGGSLNSTGRSTGGIMGDNEGASTIHNLVDNTVIVAGTENGGFIGFISDLVISSVTQIGNFWNTDNGLTDPRGNIAGAITGVAGLTNSEIDDYANFSAASWDIWDLSLGDGLLENQTWVMSNNIREPILSWSIHPICQTNIDATAYNDIGGGIITNPYKICFKEQLIDLSVNGCDSDSNTGCGSYYLLMNDIDLKGETYYPIGDGTNNFLGGFDGNGHVISNLTISAPGATDQGLFGFIGFQAIVKNLKIKLAKIDCGLDCGILAGESRGFIENVEVQGEINSDNFRAGGLIGHMRSESSARNSRARVTMTNTSGFAGGLAGFLDGGEVKNCFSSGEVTSTSTNVGGLIGSVGVNALVENSGSSVDVNGNYILGGLAGGSGTGSMIRFSYATGSITGSSVPVGGFVGSTQGSIENSYSLGDSTDAGFVGRSLGGSNIINSFSAGLPVNDGFLGDDSGGSAANNYWDNTVFADTDVPGEFNGLATTDMDNSANFNTWNGTSIWRFPVGRYPELIPSN